MDKKGWIMIDGGTEKLEQEFLGYLLARPSTTPAEFAARFRLSDKSAAYWLGCLVKSGRVRVGRIECQPTEERAATQTDREAGRPEEKGESLEVVLDLPALIGHLLESPTRMAR